MKVGIYFANGQKFTFNASAMVTAMLVITCLERWKQEITKVAIDAQTFPRRS